MKTRLIFVLKATAVALLLVLGFVVGVSIIALFPRPFLVGATIALCSGYAFVIVASRQKSKGGV